MSDFNYSPLDPASNLTSAQKMRAEDLDFYALLRRNGADGQLFFNKRRAVLFDVEAMGALRHQLVRTLGTELAMGVLLRFGYAQGYQDAETLENTFDWESEADWLAAGPKIHNLEGIVHAKTDHIEFDRESGKFLMRGKWHGSYEAEEHLKRFGPDNHPVCWTLAGYASGYATRFLGKDVLAIETECVGKGDPHCAWEIRLVDQWGAQAERYLHALQEIDLADQLSKSRRQLTQINAIIENSPAVLFRWRAKDWAVTYVSDNVKQFGYSPQMLLNGSVAFTSLIHPKDYQRLQQKVQQAISSGQHQFSCEYRLLRQNGDACWVENQLTLERAENGDVTHCQGVILDITERKRAEESLHRLSVAVEQSANTVVITDLNGYIEYVNPRFTQTTGYTREEALGQHTRILKSGFTQPEEYKEMWQTIVSGHEWRGEFHNKKKSGELYWETALISPIRDTTGEITHFLAVKEETTARKEAQLALAKRAVELETVFRVGAAATTILNVDTLLQTVADMTKDNFGLYHAQIFLADNNQNMLKLAAGAGHIGQQMVAQGWTVPYSRTNSLLVRVMQTQQGEIVNNVDDEADYQPHPLLKNTRAELAVPVMVGNELLGVLNVHSEKTNFFSEEDLKIQSTLAAQVAGAIRNARLFASVSQAQEEAETRLRETQILQQLVQSLTGALQVKEVIDAFFNACIQLLGFDFAVFSLVDEEQQRVKAVAGINVSKERIARANHPLTSNNIMANIIRTGQTEIITGQNPRFGPEDFETEDTGAWGSRIFAPISIHQKNIGLIEAGFKENITTVQESQVNLLRALIDQTAVALEGARRYEESLEAARREQLLRQVSAHIRSSADVNSILRTAAKEIGRNLQRPTSVRLARPNTNNGEAGHPAVKKEND